MVSLRGLSLVLSVACAVSTGFAADAVDEEPPKLLGRCSFEQLDREPFSEWYRPGYDGYAPNPGVLEALRRTDTGDVELTVFFGTWCGDSRREVPRWVKLIDAMGFPRDRLHLVAVDSADDAVKRSPGGEERALEIYRVPTVIVRRGDAEVARFVEHPVRSVERDLLAILDGRPYEPSYATYPVIRRWLREGLLRDPNISPRGLAGEIRHRVAGEGELAAAGRVLLSRGDAVEAVRLFQVNCDLFPESPDCFAVLAAALLETGDHEQARAAAKRALRLETDREKVDALADLLDRAQVETPGDKAHADGDRD